MADAWNIADWYAAGALGLAGEVLEKRTAARSALQKKGLPEALRAAALVFTGPGVVGDEIVAALLGPLRTADTTFSRVTGEQDLKIFAAVMIDSAPITDHAAIAARLLVVASAFSGRRSFGKLDHLVSVSREKLETAALQIRADGAPRKSVQLGAIDPATLTGDQAATAVAQAIVSTRAALVEVAAAVDHVERASARRDRNSAERMELLLMLQTGELDDGAGIDALVRESAPLSLGFSLARIFAAPMSATTVRRISRAVLKRAGVGADEEVSVEAALAAFSGGLPGDAPPLPLASALASAPADRAKTLGEYVGASISGGQISAADLVQQAVLEGHAMKAWASK